MPEREKKRRREGGRKGGKGREGKQGEEEREEKTEEEEEKDNVSPFPWLKVCDCFTLVQVTISGSELTHKSSQKGSFYSFHQNPGFWTVRQHGISLKKSDSPSRAGSSHHSSAGARQTHEDAK